MSTEEVEQYWKVLVTAMSNQRKPHYLLHFAFTCLLISWFVAQFLHGHLYSIANWSLVAIMLASTIVLTRDRKYSVADNIQHMCKPENEKFGLSYAAALLSHHKGTLDAYAISDQLLPSPWKIHAAQIGYTDWNM